MSCYKIIGCLLLSIYSMHGQELIEFTGSKINTDEKKQHIEASLFFEIKDGHHIQSVEAAEYGFIPTEVSLENDDSLEILSTEIIAVNNEGSTEAFSQSILTGVFEVRINMKISNPDIFLRGNLDYQACSDRQCFFPRTLEFQFKENLNSYKSIK